MLGILLLFKSLNSNSDIDSDSNLLSGDWSCDSERSKDRHHKNELIHPKRPSVINSTDQESNLEFSTSDKNQV